MIALEDKPEAYLVPTLIELHGKRHSVPPEAVDMIHGTVCWRPEYLIDDNRAGVTDKKGVTHYPIPLYRAKAPNATELTCAEGVRVEGTVMQRIPCQELVKCERVGGTDDQPVFAVRFCCLDEGHDGEHSVMHMSDADRR